ncbi:MAG: pyridoxamine 5'-phosphate oxidase family protein [Cognatishimia sp.]|uniref:pyridoxamine 5'-phosphate oxidase family protein n=1 Tax=Cognatishimia sp. TaxID=2211648 RepID=UPI0040594F4B
MHIISTETELEQIYDAVNPLSLEKVARQLTPKYQAWIEAARFVVLSTVGPEGTDASPRGDVDPVVRIQDPGTILIPDWRGNNRLDSLRNIVRDKRVSLMFMVPGSTNIVRVNGTAVLTNDAELCGTFTKKNIAPRSVIVMSVSEAYFQCAKAILRSELWAGQDLSTTVPSAGDFLREVKEHFDSEGYDQGYEAYAKTRFW